MRFHSLVVLCLAAQSLSAQTYSAGGGSIPDGGPVVSFPLTVSGLTPSTIDTTFGLETICLTITHTWDADLNISIQAPDGTIVDLSIGNGWDLDNYTNTCFNGFASTSIVGAIPPFTGTFKPQGFLGGVNNGQNGNGTWNLLIQDTYPADLGVLIDWNITFGNNPAIPFNFTSSDLPICVITTTGGASIPNEPKIDAFMGIIYNGPGVRNYMTDPFNAYKNKIGIELRGSSSMSFPQKNYGFETRDINGTQKDTILMGMPSEHDWILYAPYDDKTCMRNVLSYDIANKTGHYASRTKYCELVVNGQYQGIYTFMEKVKRDNNRVDIAKLLPTDITGDDLTGGYIVKIDRNDGPGSYWTSSFPADDGSAVDIVHVYPENGAIVPQQRNYIQTYIDTMETVLNGAFFAHPTFGYRKYIDVNSFIDYFLLNEASKNVDGYRLSTYLYKDKQSKGGKLHAGPAWDYNLAWWNADYCNGSTTTGWAWNIGSVCPGGWQPSFWWRRLLEDPAYTYELKCRWVELRATTLKTTTLHAWVDSVGGYLNEAQGRHFQAWPILGVYTWPNPSPIPTSYAGELTAIKTWITNRLAWMDSNLPGICNVGINEAAEASIDLSVHPNPFSNTVTLRFDLLQSEKLQIELTDIYGRSIYQLEESFGSGSNEFLLDLSSKGLAQGSYLLKVNTAAGSIVRKLSKTE